MDNQHFLMIDCETNALPDWKRPADAEDQPRLAQLAMIMFEPHEDTFRKISTFQAFVRPDGWEMEPGATAVNGLTTDLLLEKGKSIAEVLDAYEFQIKMENFGGVFAFGARFDTKIMRGEFRRADRPDLFEETPNACIMQALTGICRIPQKNGRGLKWPSLAEAMAHFNLPFPEQHTAPEDVEAAFQLVCKLKELDAVPEPRIHYAKNRPLE